MPIALRLLAIDDELAPCSIHSTGLRRLTSPPSPQSPRSGWPNRLKLGLLCLISMNCQVKMRTS